MVVVQVQVQVQVGDLLVGAGDLAVQAPPLAHQELLREGFQGGQAGGDPAWPWPCPPGYGGGGWLGLQLPIPRPMCRRAGSPPVVGVVVVVVHGVQDH